MSFLSHSLVQSVALVSSNHPGQSSARINTNSESPTLPSMRKLATCMTIYQPGMPWGCSASAVDASAVLSSVEQVHVTSPHMSWPLSRSHNLLHKKCHHCILLLPHTNYIGISGSRRESQIDDCVHRTSLTKCLLPALSL